METLRYGKVKARKAHVCSFCGCTISVGETYWRSTHKANGELYDWKSHEKCAELVDMLSMEGDEGVTLADFYECITDAFDKIWDEMDPEMVESKDFVTPEFSKQRDFVYNHLKHREVKAMKKEHFDFLINNRACVDGVEWAKTQSDLYELWNNCHRGDWMLWLAKRLKVDEKKQMLCGALCAHTVIHLMMDRRSREAVRMTFLYARGKAADVQLHEARNATAYAATTSSWAAAAGGRRGSALRTAEIARKILTHDVFEKISTL